jgi:hypothetical protein
VENGIATITTDGIFNFFIVTNSSELSIGKFKSEDDNEPHFLNLIW